MANHFKSELKLGLILHWFTLRGRRQRLPGTVVFFVVPNDAHHTLLRNLLMAATVILGLQKSLTIVHFPAEVFFFATDEPSAPTSR